MAHDERLDAVRLLLRHEAGAELRMGFVRRDRLAAGSFVATPHPVHFQRRACPLPLQRGVAVFAEQRGRAHVGQEARLVERKRGEGVAFVFRQRDHIVIEPRDRDAPVR